MLDRQESAADIDGVRLLPGFQREFPDVGMGGFVRDSGVGYQDVDWAEVVDGGAYACGDGCFVGYVSLDMEEVRVSW